MDGWASLDIRLNWLLLGTPHGRSLFAFGDAMLIGAGLVGITRVPIACPEHIDIYQKVFEGMHTEFAFLRPEIETPTPLPISCVSVMPA